MADETVNQQGGQSQEGGEQQQSAPSEPQAAAAGAPSKDAKMWAMLCHLLAIFTGFIAPLIIWLIKKDEDAFVDAHGKQALNWQFTVLIALIVSGLTWFLCIGVFLTPAIYVCNIVFCIIAAIRANDGQPYKYPVAIPFFK